MNKFATITLMVEMVCLGVRRSRGSLTASLFQESNGRRFEGRNNERPSIYGRGMSDNRTTTATDPGLCASSKTWSRDHDSADLEAWIGSAMWDAGERCGRGLRMRIRRPEFEMH